MVSMNNNLRQYILFGVLTLIFITVNIMTLTWTPLPWFDEAWFVDTAVNFALDNHWTTTAQISYAGETPIALYPPLYQFLLGLWIKVFGFSIFTVRSFNIIIAAACSLFLFLIFRKMGYLKQTFTIVLFVFLFWGTGLFAWSYRNGRPDMVNLLFTILLVYQYIMYIKDGGNCFKYGLFLNAVLLLTSGLQAIPFVVFFLVFVYILNKQIRNKTFVSMISIFTGFIVGILIIYCHFVILEHPKSFFWQFAQSETISNLLHKIPFISDNIVLASKENSDMKESFISGLIDCYLQNKNYIIFTAVNFIAVLFLYLKRIIKLHTIEIQIYLFSILMPVVMFLAGHCLSPYTWMFFFPAVGLCIILIEKYKNMSINIVYCALTIAFTIVLGLPNALIKSDKNVFNNISEFIDKQRFEKDVSILSCYCAYYQLRSITKNSYNAIYPIEQSHKNVDYILQTEIKEHDSEQFSDRIKSIIDSGKTIECVDSMNYYPKLKLYKVVSEE